MGRQSPQKGFTLLELVVVMALMGMILSFTLPRLQESLFSGGKKKLFRSLILTVKALKENAVGDQRTFFLHVDIDSDSIWTSHEAMTEEELAREKENRTRLSGELSIVDVVYPGKGMLSQGETEVGFYKKGYSDYALIHLVEGDDRFYTMVIEPFLPEMKLLDGYLKLE